MTPYTFEEILLILERGMMFDVADRLRELWHDKEREIDSARDNAAFIINQKLKEMRHPSWSDCEGVPV